VCAGLSSPKKEKKKRGATTITTKEKKKESTLFRPNKRPNKIKFNPSQTNQ
jgi:hypothetical protein